MAATIYSFQADLTQLLKLNSQLERANMNLKSLKANTLAYSAQAKKISVMGSTMKKNTSALRGANVQAKALNATGGRMVAIFRSASIAIVSAFAFRAILGGMRGIITSFSNFEQQMAAVKAISGATGKEFEKLNDTALELGRSTIFTAKQVGELQEEYARLGFTADEIVAAQQGTIMLAAATGESLKSSAETSGAVIRAFGLDAADTTRVVDIMGASFTSSALNLNRFRESMKFVAPVAKAAGFTIEETSAMLAKLADNGLHGSIAGNALKNIMLRLGDANSKLNKKLGKTVQGLPQFIDALKGMKDESFGLTEAVTLLDKRSAPAFLALLGNIEGLGDQLGTLHDAEGAVSRMSQIRLDTLEGDFTLLKSATEGLGVAIGGVFENSMRQSIYSLTEWVQGLASSEKFMTGLSTAFSMATTVVKALLVRFALLKLSTLSIALNFKGLTVGLKMVTVGFRTFGFSVKGVTMALRGLKMALASTGVGLIIVAIGSLVGWLTKTKDETSAVVHQMDRMHDSFEKDIMSVATMNVENTERVDLLRKLNQDYPELIGNIDLEIASNEELLEILGLINNTRAERSLVKDKQEEIDIIWKKVKLDELAYRKTLVVDKAEEKAFRDRMANDEILSMVEVKRVQRLRELIRMNENNIIIINNNAKKQEKLLLKDIKIFQDMIKKKQKANGTFNKLSIEEAKSFRMGLRKGYLDDLEAFRDTGTLKESRRKKMSKKAISDWMSNAKIRQEILLDKAKAEKTFLQKVQKYHSLSASLGKGSTQDQKDAKAAYNLFIKDLDKGEQTTLKTHPLALNKVGIKIAEMRTYVTNLSAALLRSGPAFEESALGVHKLNSTKNRIKELMKLKVEAITSVEEREKRGVEVGYEAKEEKYEKEKKLIETNLLSIQMYMSSLDANSDDMNKEFITKNKTKYDVLKNTTAQGWVDLNAEGAVGILARSNMLQSMHDEEGARWKTNGELIIETDEAKDKALRILANEQAQSKLGHIKNALKTEMSTMDTGFESIFRSNKVFKEKLTANATQDLALNEERRVEGVISEEEAAATKLAINKSLSDELNALEDQRLAKIKEVYGAIAGAIMDVSANLAAVKIQGIEEDAQREMDIEQTKFDRRLEIAEKAGKNTEGMQKKHDIKMKTMEQQKEADIRAIKKKQFMLQKANDITMAVINGAIAITKVTAQTGIGAIAAAPLTAGMIAMQIAAIASRQFVGEKGGITPFKGSLDKFANGGMVVGPSHAQGGVKFASGGRVSELEGGEAVINKRSTAMYRPQLSAMNAAGGGVKFAAGGMTPGMRSTMEGAKDNWSASDIAGLITNSINSQQVFVTESDISSSQSTVDIIEGHSSLF